jgi:hypothetical protein
LDGSNKILEVPILIMGMEGEFRAGIVPGILSMSESEGGKFRAGVGAGVLSISEVQWRDKATAKTLFRYEFKGISARSLCASSRHSDIHVRPWGWEDTRDASKLERNNSKWTRNKNKNGLIAQPTLEN